VQDLSEHGNDKHISVSIIGGFGLNQKGNNMHDGARTWQ